MHVSEKAAGEDSSPSPSLTFSIPVGDFSSAACDDSVPSLADLSLTDIGVSIDTSSPTLSSGQSSSDRQSGTHSSLSSRIQTLYFLFFHFTVTESEILLP
ncbi:hypothetical protein Hanom_Chr16g01514151 [Helianthus anomalus]